MKLVNADGGAAGYNPQNLRVGMALDAASGMSRSGGWTGSLSVRVGQRTIPFPVEMVKEPYGNGGGVEIAIG